MKASDLDLTELLDHDPTNGGIQLKERRMLQWDADAFGSLRRELIDSLGLERARQILRRFGFASGYRDGLTSSDEFNGGQEAEWFLACPTLQNDQGSVDVDAKHFSVDLESGTFEMDLVWKDSYEAAQHARVYGRSEEPVCWSAAGYASGFATALMGEEVYVVETECAAMGGDTCHVVGKTKRAWGEEGARRAADYRALNLSAELAAHEDKLGEQRRELGRKERELAELRGSDRGSRGGIVCKSRAMENVLDLVETVARVDTNVLITGENGSGRELVARFLHDESPRAEGPFSTVNCGALPERLLESELFGHVRGAFSGADADSAGLFEQSQGGTLFLHEIGEISEASQVKLLRVLEEREVHPLGASFSRPVDVRVIAATSSNLAEMVSRGAFRKELYDRLKPVSVDVPPLRERREDILPLAREFIARARNSFGIEERTLAPDAVDTLTAYSWPGNVRELRDAMERAVTLAGDRPRIMRDDLPPETRNQAVSTDGLFVPEIMSMAALERRYILQVLERFNGNRTHTAKALGIGANTLWRKLKSWGVPPAREPSS